VGDRVMVDPFDRETGVLLGERVDGGLAEYVRVPAGQLVSLPDEVSFEQAAALPVAYGTAYRMMVGRGGLPLDGSAAGQRILILGASGGVGTCCVQLARLSGAEVIVAASSEDKLQRLAQLGAHHGVNYKDGDFMKAVQALVGKPKIGGGGGVDMVVNFTGGDTWVPSLRCLTKGGKLLTCGATAGYDPKEDLRYIWSFELQVVGSNSFYDDNLKALMDLIQQGKMKPVIDEVLPLEKAAQGLKLIEDREVFGKVIITP
jgi:alcohol dehydrogenase